MTSKFYLILANLLTLARIIIGPLFLIFYIYYEKLGISFLTLPFVLIFIVILAEISDLLDGFLARKMGAVTDLGKLLDPMADSIFRLSVFFSFTKGAVELPLILVCILFYRESIIGTLRNLCALSGKALAARVSGKIKAIMQALAIMFILVMMIPYSKGYISLDTFRNISFYSALFVVLYTLFSGAEYIYTHRSYIKKSIKNNP